MAKGKDGFTALSVADGAEEIVDEENGILISMIVQQYFLALKVFRKWRRGGRIRDLFRGLKQTKAGEGELGESAADDNNVENNELSDDESDDGELDVDALHSGLEGCDEHHGDEFHGSREFRIQDLISRVGLKWTDLAGVKGHAHVKGEGLEADWTRSVAPRVEGRICTV